MSTRPCRYLRMTGNTDEEIKGKTDKMAKTKVVINRKALFLGAVVICVIQGVSAGLTETSRKVVRSDADPLNFCWAKLWPDGEIWLNHSCGVHTKSERWGGLFSPDRGVTWQVSGQNDRERGGFNKFVTKDGLKRGVSCWDGKSTREHCIRVLTQLANGTFYSVSCTVVLPWASELYLHRETVHLRDGRLLQTAYGKREGEKKMCSMVLQSQDDGLTWRYLSRLPYEPNLQEGYNESSVVELKDGRLLIFARTGNSLHRLDGVPLVQFASYDGGETWTDRRIVSEVGVNPQAQILSDGTLVVLTGRPGIFLLVDRTGNGMNYERINLYEGRGSSYGSLMEVAPGKLLLMYDESQFFDVPGDGPENRIIQVSYAWE